MKQISTYIFMVVILLLVSCNSSDDLDSIKNNFLTDEDWREEILDGSSVTIKPFVSGDAITRSALAFDGQNLVFGWHQGDEIGLYPTAKDVEKLESRDGLLNPEDNEANKHISYPTENLWRTNPLRNSQSKFVATELKPGSQTIKIDYEYGDFLWDDVVRWSAYFPYSADDIDKNNGGDEIKETYVSRFFDFSGQIQNGLVNISAYKKGTTGEDAGASNSVYRASEATACAHLGDKDVLISPETAWSDNRIHFQMRHVGAVIRLYLLAPKEDLIIKDIKLICDSKIFYEKGQFTLLSHPYNANATDGNYGVNLDLTSDDCQIKALPVGEPKNNLVLKFADGTAKTVYDASDSYKRYVTAYIMTYPITYDPEVHGNLFAYVTAYKQGESADKEYHFVSKALEGKVMKPGCYYQWTSSTHADDGLYPIELTATLLPWQDIVGGGIPTDLEK